MLRFAPSPIGDMHISDLRIAIFNYLISQQRNDCFLVRIEDIGEEENIEGKDSEIMLILEKFALIHNSVFHQSEHLNLYQTLALKLLKEEKAFVCKCKNLNEEDFCSAHCETLTPQDHKALQASGEKFVIRVKKPKKSISFSDTIHGNITVIPEQIDTFIIIKEDGKPTYDFASATDDMMSDIDFIIRAETYLVNTPKQLHIKNLLDYDKQTKHAHIPSLEIADEHTFVKSLFEQGFIPDAILNYLLLIGNTKLPQEIFTLPQAIEWFDLNNISNKVAQFDIEKLRLINREHIKRMDDRQLSTLFGFADANIGKLAKVYLEECSTLNELEEKIRPIFSPKDFAKNRKMKNISDIIFDAPEFETLEELKTYISTQSGLKDEDLLKPLQYLLTGAKSSPELSKVYPHIKSYILEVAS